MCTDSVNVESVVQESLAGTTHEVTQNAEVPTLSKSDIASERWRTDAEKTILVKFAASGPARGKTCVLMHPSLKSRNICVRSDYRETFLSKKQKLIDSR